MVKYQQRWYIKAISIFMALAMAVAVPFSTIQTYATEDGMHEVTSFLPMMDDAPPAFGDWYPEPWEPDTGDIPLCPGCKRVKATIVLEEGVEVERAHFVVLNHGATPPNSSQVKEGLDSEGNEALCYISTDFKYHNNILSDKLPADDTTYDCWVVLEDADENLSEPKMVALTTPIGILSDGFPRDRPEQPLGSRQVEILVQANVDATAYYVVVNYGDEAPTYQQVEAGKDSTGSSALAAGSMELEGNTLSNARITLPADDTDYDAYVVIYRNHDYGDGFVEEIRSEVVKLSVRTPEGFDSTTWEVSNDVELKNALDSFEDGDTIKLTENINYSDGISIGGKAVTLDIGHHTLNISSDTGDGFTVYSGGNVDVIGSGSLNIFGDSTGLKVSNWSRFAAHENVSCFVECTGSGDGVVVGNDGYLSLSGSVIGVKNGIKCGSSGMAIIKGDVEATYTDLSAQGIDNYGGTVTVIGNVAAWWGLGVYCRSGDVSVTGDVTGFNRGAIVSGSSPNAADCTITIGGNLQVNDLAEGRGAVFTGSGIITVEGEIMAPIYINSLYVNYDKDDNIPSDKPDYRMYHVPDESHIVYVKDTASPAVYSITIQNDGNGTASADLNWAEEGTEITLMATPDSGYRFKEWQVISGDVSISDDKFTMPAANVIIKAIFEPIPVRSFTVTFNLNGGIRTGGGELTQTVISSGSAIAPTVTRSGYTFAGWDKAFNNVTSDLTVNALWSYNGGNGGSSSDDDRSGSSDNSNGGDEAGSSDNDSDSDQGDSSDDDSTPPATPPETDEWLERSETSQPISEAKEKGLDYILTRRNSQYGVRKEAWEALAGYKFRHDTMDSTTVQVRVYVKDPTAMASDLLVSGYVKGLEVDDIKAIFEKWFKNKVGVIHLDQADPWGQSVEIAAKVDLTGMDVAKLSLYSYDKVANTYKRIEKPAYWIDKNGYLHFSTQYAGDIIISEGSLDAFAVRPVKSVPKETTPGSAWQNPFEDVREDDWFYHNVEYTFVNGLFSGTGVAAFSPDMLMTRGMMVTVLGHMSNADVSGYVSSFDDVPDDAYYAKYTEWAREKGIVSGVGGNRFAPDASITRQDMAVMLERYASVMGLEAPEMNAVETFIDDESISAYAKDAVAAMQKAGVISGKPGGVFDPKAGATRAEVSAILHSFMLLFSNAEDAVEITQP